MSKLVAMQVKFTVSVPDDTEIINSNGYDKLVIGNKRYYPELAFYTTNSDKDDYIDFAMKDMKGVKIEDYGESEMEFINTEDN